MGRIEVTDNRASTTIPMSDVQANTFVVLDNKLCFVSADTVVVIASVARSGPPTPTDRVLSLATLRNRQVEVVDVEISIGTH